MSLGCYSALLTPPHIAPSVDEAASASSGNGPSLTDDAKSAVTPSVDSEAEAFEFLRILSSLTGIEIKLFRDEPELVIHLDVYSGIA